LTSPPDARTFVPTLAFSKNEQYYPCELFFDGRRDVITNKERYDARTDSDKLGMMCCYYTVVSGLQYYIYEYWFYYAFNPYAIIDISKNIALADNHEHDFESAYVYVNKETLRPEKIVLNQHFWHNIEEFAGGKIKVFVERGGHGMFGRRNHWLTRLMDELNLLKWDPGGLEFKPERVIVVDELRKEVMSDPANILDISGKIIGDDYESSRIGKMFGPSVPWWRPHYYLPETLLRGLDRVVPDRVALAFKLPSTPPLSLFGSVSLPQGYENLDQAVRRALEIGMLTATEFRELRERGLLGLPGRRIVTRRVQAGSPRKSSRKSRRTT